MSVLNSILVPSDFDYKMYLKLNPDLKQTANKRDAIQHYIQYGYHENRIYKIDKIPNDFYWFEYLILNSDLDQCWTKQEVLYHYIKCGQSEKRKYKLVEYPIHQNKYPDDFNWKTYLLLNNDLKKVYSTEEEAVRHYTNYGIYENRIFANAKSQFLKYFPIIEPLKSIYLYHMAVYCIKKNNKTLTSFTNNYKLLSKYYSLNAFKQIEYYTNIKENCSTNDDTNINTYNTAIIEVDETLIDIYTSYILIVDAPEYIIGGTRFFINSIISNYNVNHNTAFLIIRPNQSNNTYTLSINNRLNICTKYDMPAIYNVLNNVLYKINKIFINHYIQCSNPFINMIMSLKKHKTYITHDHYLIGIHPQMLIDELCQLNQKNILSKFDTIITQNINNAYMFKNNTSLNTLIVSPLPDYSETLDQISTQNNNIVVGIIGCIADIKGSEIIKALFDVYDKTNIKLVVFGEVQNYVHHNINKYKNIREFNNLMLNYKPNAFIETSIWPETYSYTLTLAMLTQLPIFSLKKPFSSVIENRLLNYANSYTYTNIHELTQLITNYKQHHFYTINPTIYYNSFWDNYFITSSNNIEMNFIKYRNLADFITPEKITNKNIVVITSKIYVSNVHFTYSTNRSIYTVDERFMQTLQSIESVRTYIPNSFIILMDNSEFIDKNEYKQQLSNKVDYFINIYDNDILNYYTNNCRIKYFAELTQMIFLYYSIFSVIEPHLDSICHYFKLSGRYFINSNFNYEQYDNTKLIFKINQLVKPEKEYYYTSFYKLPKHYVPIFFKYLIEIYNEKELNSTCDFEMLVGNKLKNDMQLVDTLGITQRIACWHEISDI